MFIKLKSICSILALGFLIISNINNCTYAAESQECPLDQHFAMLLYKLTDESTQDLAKVLHGLTETVEENVEGGEKIKFVTYDQNKYEHAVSQQRLQDALSQNYYESPLSVGNGDKLPANRAYFKSFDVLHTPFIAFETRFWPKETEQLPILFPTTEGLEEILKSLPKPKFTIKDFQFSLSKISANLEPDEDTKNLRDKIIAPYIEFYNASLESKIPDYLYDIFSSIKSAENIQEEAIKIASRFISALSSESNFEKENTARFIVQFFSAITDKKISPYDYGRWFTPRELPEFAKGLDLENENVKVVYDYFVYAVPSFMKVIKWEPRMSLISLIARSEDHSGEMVQLKELTQIQNTSINQTVLSKLNEIIQERTIQLAFEKAAFNKGDILAAFEFGS